MVLAINGIPHEHSTVEIKEPRQAADLRVRGFRMLISFFELLDTCVGVKLRSPIREDNGDPAWLKIPLVTDNDRLDYIIKTLRQSSPLILDVARYGCPYYRKQHRYNF